MRANKDVIRNKELKESQMVKESLCGEIKFRKSRKLELINIFLKGMTYILVAAVSGSLAGIYVANKKSAEVVIANTNKAPLFMQNTSGIKENNAITRIVADIGQSVVGISSNDDGIFDDQNYGNVSGVIFKSDGYILTNYSGIKLSNKHMVKLSNGKNIKPIEAKVVGHDDITDLAVLKIDRKNLPIAVFGDASEVQVGSTAVAMGNNNGEFTSTVTKGIVSALGRKEKLFYHNTGAVTMFKIIQTDAEINDSNIGGPLCNDNGEVIGINQRDENGKSGYAIQIDEVEKVADAIIKNGHVSRPCAGFVSEAYATNNKKEKGVIVKSVISGTGAEKAGIKVNDIIVEFDMLKVKSNYDLNDVIQRHSTGDIIPCKILRGDKTINLKLTLSESPVNDN